MKKIVKTVGLISAEIAIVKKVRKHHSFDGYIGNGDKLIAALGVLGIEYDPANPNISLAKLIQVQKQILTDNNNVTATINPEKETQLARQEAYDLMKAFTTDALNAFKASEGVTPAQILIAINLAKGVFSIRIISIKSDPVQATDGSGVVTSSDAEVNAIRRNSVSEQQFSGRTGNFFKFVTYLSGQTAYNPNELRLTIASLMAYYNSLAPLNVAAEAAIFATNLARKKRNLSFFENTKGSRFLYTQAKKYVASRFGIKSAEYKEIKGLPFPNLIKKKDRTPETMY
jgi:hypothetical protein